jgi:hypothetical protein
MSDTNEIEFTDRYQALGIPYPDPATMCAGQCEGIGRYPVRLDDTENSEGERRRWHEEEVKSPTNDGVHFILCPTCDGSGKRPAIA